MKKLILLCLCSVLAGALGARLNWLPERPADLSVSETSSTVRAELVPLDELRVVKLSDDDAPDPHGLVRLIKQDDASELMTQEERLNVGVYEKVNRSVVNISTRSVREDPFFMFESPSEGAGSGSIIDRRGHVLTNFHVIEDALVIQVTLFDGSSYEARPVGVDPTSDLAILRIDAPEGALFPVALGDSTNLKVGQRVLAIGNPFGLERTLTVGIVSSLNRVIRSRNGRRIYSIIQTDAAINPGNSGGPLLNNRGQLIGVTTAIASRTGQNSGVGFAIPATAVRRIVPQLIRNGRVVRADIGISRVAETEQGLLIVSTTPDGPAEKAGLRGFELVKKRRRRGPYVYEQTYIDRSTADLIVAVDEVAVNSGDRFLDLIESHKPGDVVTVTILRDGRTINVQVELESDE